MTMTGEVGILNVGAGDTKLSFDPKNKEERERAARIVTDMIRRGYTILVEIDDGKGGKKNRRVRKFDAKQCEYIIAAEPSDEQERSAEAAAATPTRGKKADGGATRRIPAERARATAIPRSAGG